MYKQEEFLLLSGLQHFIFCRRQWALIHIEQIWSENYRTADGRIMHEKTHNGMTESRGDLLITRSMQIHSERLGVSGQCDVVEFHKDEHGITLPGYSGCWRPYPVEYKRGIPKDDDCDILQLCGQAMCLEEMLCCEISEGALYYGETHHRIQVKFTSELRGKLESALLEMHDFYKKGYTPKVKPKKGCNACSLKDSCIPKLMKSASVHSYLHRSLEDLS